MPHVGTKGHDNSLESSSLTFSWHLPKRSPGMLAFHQSHNPKIGLMNIDPTKKMTTAKKKKKQKTAAKKKKTAKKKKKKNVTECIVYMFRAMTL